MSANNLRLNKTSSKIPVHMAIEGDQLTSKLILTIDRYSDGVDLAGLGFAVYVKNAADEQDIITVNPNTITDSEILIEWELPQVVGNAEGMTEFAVMAVNAQKNMVWQSGVRQIRINQKFEVNPNYDPRVLSTFERVLSEMTIEMGEMRETMDGYEDRIERAENAAYTASSNATSIYTIVKRAYESGAFNGSDGVSPDVSIRKDGSVTTITITDHTGTKTATILDGERGSDATVTEQSILNALGFKPVNPKDVPAPYNDTAIRAEISRKADKTDIPDVSGFAKKTDIPDPYDDTALRREISEKANRSELPDVSGFAKKTDIPAPYDDAEIRRELADNNEALSHLDELLRQVRDALKDGDIERAINLLDTFLLDEGGVLA